MIFTFEQKDKDIGSFDNNQSSYTVAKGNYKVGIGALSRNTKEEESFHFDSNILVSKVNNVLETHKIPKN